MLRDVEHRPQVKRGGRVGGQCDEPLTPFGLRWSDHPGAQGQDDSHEQGLSPGVGAEVDAGRVSPRLVEHRHPPGRGPRAEHRDGQQQSFAASQEPQADDEKQRGEHVELFLDGKRPDVLERRRGPVVLEVGDVGGDLVPVGAVGQGREDRSRPPVGLLGTAEDHQVGGQPDQGHQDGR